MRERLLKVVRMAPWGIVFVLIVIVVATPWELGRTMIEMTLQGVPARSIFSDTTTRYSSAEQWFVDREHERASQDWPHVQFAQTAEAVALLMPDEIDRECREGLAREGMLASNSPAHRALEAFVAENPGTEVAMYLVPQPPMPSLELTMTAYPDDRLPGEYEALWYAIVGSVGGNGFEPNAWAPPGRFAETGSSQVWSFMVADGGPGEFRRQIVLGNLGSDRERFLNETDLWVERQEQSQRVHAPLRDAPWGARVDEPDACSGCHLEHRADWNYEEPALSFVRWGHTMFLTEPMRLDALVQAAISETDVSHEASQSLLYHALGDGEFDYFELGPALGESEDGDTSSSRHATLVWELPESDKRGQTYLFFCSFEGDPVGEFQEAIAAPDATRARGVRSWIAAYTPPALGAGLLVLLGSVIAAPIAAGVQARADAERQLQADLARVRRDAHDRVYNRLTALSRRVDEDSQLDGVGGDIRSTVKELQQILGNVNGIESDHLGNSLETQLAAVASMQTSLHGVEVGFDAIGESGSVSPRLAWDLQCILEEAINNAVRHGGAARVEVQLKVDDGVLELRVADDGGGIGELDSSEASGSTGVAGMRGRVEAWGGELSLGVSDNGGAEVTARIRLP